MTTISHTIALDVGDRYVGIAATDHADAIAYRYATLDRTILNPFIAIADIVRAEAIVRIVVGVPYHVEDGSETAQTAKTKEFIQMLQESLSPRVEIVEVDETLTSAQARANLKQEGASEKEEHAEAARLMLQEYIQHA